MREQLFVRPAINIETMAGLIAPDLAAGVGANLAIDLVDSIASGFEVGLDLLDRSGAQLANVAPWRREFATAGNAVRKMADKERIEVGWIVPFDDHEVLEDQECRPPYRRRA